MQNAEPSIHHSTFILLHSPWGGFWVAINSQLDGLWVALGSHGVALLARATNASAVPAFSVVWSNIAGREGTTSLTDPDRPAGRGAFYRVAGQPP